MVATIGPPQSPTEPETSVSGFKGKKKKVPGTNLIERVPPLLLRHRMHV